MFIPEDVFENTSDELSAVIAGVLDDDTLAQPATSWYSKGKCTGVSPMAWGRHFSRRRFIRPKASFERLLCGSIQYHALRICPRLNLT